MESPKRHPHHNQHHHYHLSLLLYCIIFTTISLPTPTTATETTTTPSTATAEAAGGGGGGGSSIGSGNDVPGSSSAVGVCSLGRTSWNPGARARFGLSISLRKADKSGPQGCGMVSQEALQLYVAAQWVCERLNAALPNPQGNGTSSFIPGVQFGFDLLDDCRFPTRAVQYALDYVDLTSQKCHVTANGSSAADDAASSELRIGLVGPTRSSTAEETADAMRSIHLPIISPSATLASLTEGDTSHPNFFRTVPSDKLQIKTIVKILKQLLWTYLVVVYTDDNYGEAGARLLQEQARIANVCVNDSIAIQSNTPMADVVSRLVRKRQDTEGESMAVVYIGGKDKAENLVFNVRSLEAYGFHFIMSDSVSTNTDVFNSGRLVSGKNIALGSLTLAPSSVVLKEFEDYLNQKYRDVKKGLVQDDVIKSYLLEIGMSRNQADSPLPVKQISFVPLAVGAIFALAEATRQAHADRCGAGAAGVCPGLVESVRNGDILARLPNVSVDYGRMDAGRAPQEFKDARYVLQFDVNGDVVPKPELPDYTVFAYNDDLKQMYHQVATFSGGDLTLDMSSVRMLDKNGQVTSELPTSVCAGSCAECADNGKISLAHINGSAYIIGVFSMHERNADQPFKCGDFRNVSHDAVVLEAFLHAVEHLRRTTGINFGAVAFDDCYSSLHITSILSDFMSGLVPYDKGLFEVSVPEDSVVGVVGSLSSDSTLAVAGFTTPQRLPTISYASSSPDLDDTVNYPYFLRTVPSDEEQAIAMTQVIQAMGWEYVGLLYVANNYGTKGAQAFQRVANERGVCVAEPVPISVNPTNVDEKHLYDAFVKLMQQSVKVVVFFGIDTRMADFLRLIESRNEQGSIVFIASEEWGTKIDVLAAGQKAARGAITFKVDNTYIDPAIEDTLRTKLLEKTPREDDVNPWFSEFWQHVFDCNIPGGFNNIFTRNCDSNMRLSRFQVDMMVSDQRVKHVMNAVQAMASGLAQAGSQICEDLFPCSFLRSDKYADEVFDAIKSQTVSVGSIKEQLFDQNGNGNIGFSIYNIQRQGDGYVYIPVGTYSKKNGLQITPQNLRFYTETGLSLERVEALCADDLCSAPECVKTPDVPPTHAPDVTTDKEFRVADMVILIVLVVFCLLLICCMCLGFKYFRQKVRSLSKDLQDSKNEHIYDMASTPRHLSPTYGNVDQRAVLTLPLNPSHSSSLPRMIQFVNGGLSTASNSPGNTLDGRSNPAFVPDRTTPSASETNLSPVRHRTPPPPPPLPNRSPAPSLHHSMSAMARLQHNDDDDDDNAGMSGTTSSKHSYYMAHSLSSHRELPALPSTEGAVGPQFSSAHSLRSFQSCPAESRERMENIPLNDLSPVGASFPQRGDSRYLHAAPESEPSLGDGQLQNPGEGDDIQYFRMTPSGELDEEEGVGDAGGLMTYSLTHPDEDRPNVNTYSLSPQMAPATQQPQHYSPSRLSREYFPGDRSDSLSPTQYTGVASMPQERSDTPNTFPGFIQPLRITPEMRDMILSQMLLESLSPPIQQQQQQQELRYPAGPPQSSLASSSSNSSASPRPHQQNYRPQHSHPASAHYPSSSMSEGAAAATMAAPPRHSFPMAQPMSLTPAPPPQDRSPPSAHSAHSGMYVQHGPGDVQQRGPLCDMPQTDLSTPYARMAQGQSSAPQTPQMSNREAEYSRSPSSASDPPGATSPRMVPIQERSPQPPHQQHMQPQPPQSPPQERQQQHVQQHVQQQQQQQQQADGENDTLWASYGVPMNVTTV